MFVAGNNATCAGSYPYAGAVNTLARLYLPVSPDVPVPLSISVKTLTFDFQSGNKVVANAVVSIRVNNNEWAAISLSADANPGFADPDALLLFEQSGTDKLGLKLCLNQIAFRMTDFTLNHANPQVRAKVTKLINQQLDIARSRIGPAYCTDVVKEVTPPPYFFGKGLRSMRPRIYVNASELILETEVVDYMPASMSIQAMLLEE